MEQSIDIQQNIMGFDELIRDQVDSMEVLWGLKGYTGRLKIEYSENVKASRWIISRSYDEEQYPDFYMEVFNIYISKTPDVALSARTEVNLRRLGYSSLRQINILVPGLFQKRESLQLRDTEMQNNWFEFKTKEDLIDLFKLIENSPTMTTSIY